MGNCVAPHSRASRLSALAPMLLLLVVCGLKRSAGQGAPQRCTEGLTIPHMSSAACSGSTGEACSYSCQAGFAQGGAHICQADGSFAGGSCDPQPCTGGLDIPHASSGSCSGSVGDVCAYACERGYAKGATHTCGVSGAFAGGSCDPQPCAAETPQSASAACTGSTGDSCGLRCQPGYQVAPAGFDLTCSWNDQASRVEWVGDASCAARQCLPSLTSPTDGSVDITNGGMFPSTATFDCNVGYVRQGSAVLTCQTSGAWSTSAPVCSETCANQPCEHGAECSDAGGTGPFRCQCPVPRAWEGERCEIDVNECDTDHGSCDILQDLPLSECSNSEGSYQCTACNPAAFEETLPRDTGGAAMQTCCYAPTPGEHHVPCDASQSACTTDAVGIEAGCMGPADATKSRPRLFLGDSVEEYQELTVRSGGSVSVSVVARDVNNRISTLPRAEGADGGSASISGELLLQVRGPDHFACISPSLVCSIGYGTAPYCMHGGTCTPGRDLVPSCTCPPGVSGTQCEHVDSPCVANPCGSGTCVTGLGNDYCCVCPAGLAGTDCSISTATVCNGTIVEELCCGESGCVGSRDVIHFCSKECAAVALRFAEDCQGEAHPDTYVRVMASLHGLCNSTACSLIDACSSAPCSNGGTCKSTGVATYECVCDSSWVGAHCESPVPECEGFRFSSGRHVVSLPETRVAGDYAFSVWLREAELLESPLLVLHAYPSVVNASQSTVDLGYNISEAGRVNSFWVTPRDEFGNVRDPVAFPGQQFERDRVIVDLTLDNQAVRSEDWQTVSADVCTWEPRAHAFMCAWFAQRAGNYTVTVSISTYLGPSTWDTPVELLDGSALNVVPGPYDSTKTLIDPPPATIVAGVPILVNITAFDSYANVRQNNDTLIASVQPITSTNLSWAFEGEKYEVSFAANVSVVYSLFVSLGDSALLGSPYTIGVRQADVDLGHSEVGTQWGCVERCLTMPDVTMSVDVIVRDRFHNVRDNLDLVGVEVSYTHCTTTSCETTSVDWNEEQQAYNVSFALYSPTEYSYSIAILVNTEMLRSLDYHYAFHTNLNASMCATASCYNALDAAQFVDRWNNQDVCISAGCLYQAAVLQTVTFFVDAATSALYPIEELQPVLQITPRCENGRLSKQFYWKDESYCATSSSSTNSQQVYRRDGLNLFIDFTVERPGLYTLSQSLRSMKDGNAVWTGIGMDIEVQPGPPSLEHTVLTYQMSSSTITTPLAGVQYLFNVQVLDANSNPRFGLDELLVDLRIAGVLSLNALSQAKQPTTTYVYRAATPRIAATTATDEELSSGSARAEHSFNLTISSRGIYDMNIWICPGDRLDLCNTSQPPIDRANPLRFTVCPLNSVVDGFNDPSGLVEGARLHECFCDTGFFGDHGGYPHACLPCDGGSYTDEIGQAACTECDAGYSCDCSSVSSKIPCSAGSEAACTQCQGCGIGRYQNLEGQTSCNECPDGFECPLSAMTLPIAKKGYWISADGLLDRHDCAVAGHMPDACPGGDLQALVAGSEFTYCFRERHDILPDECKPVLGSVCSDGYFGPGCTKCCKLNEECSHLQSKRNPETQQLYKMSWYLTESEGRCKECPDQDLLELAVFGTVGSIFVANKLIRFAEVAKLSGALHAPLVSLLNFFQLCDLFKGINLQWPQPVKDFIENFLSIFVRKRTGCCDCCFW